MNNDFKINLKAPASYYYAINTAFQPKSHKIKHTFINKIIATACAITTIFAGVVFAKNFIGNIFNDNNGMTKAIENGYIFSPTNDYIECSNIKARVDNVLMDEKNLSFVLNLVLPEDYSPNLTKDINFPNMLITDEENRILYCGNYYAFENFKDNNNLSYNYGDFGENYINSGINMYLSSQNKNELTIVFNIFADKFPNSKNLKIQFGEIDLGAGNSLIVLNGNWVIDISLPEKFYNRETTSYHILNMSDNAISLTEAYSFASGMYIKFETDVTPVSNENDFYEWGLSFKDNFVTNEYLEDENGNRFYPVKANSESSGSTYELNGKFTHWQTFDLTNSENSQVLYLHLTLNTMDTSKEVVITLEKN